MDKLKIYILPLNDINFTRLGEVSVPDTFIASSRNFHPEGLFSTEIFGKRGDADRLTQYGYINLVVPIMHPSMYIRITRAKEFYKDIMAGNAYAKYNAKTHLFEPADISNGQTGYQFFMSKINTFTLEATGSDTRKQLIDAINQNRKHLSITKLIVVPAALREYDVDEDGRAVEDEINPLYRTVINSASLISKKSTGDEPILDALRYRIQNAVVEIDEYIDTVLMGKKKALNKKVAGRSIHGGSRNVLSALVQTEPDLDGPNFTDVNSSIMGLYQFIKSTILQATHYIQNGFMLNVMPGEDYPFKMTDQKTLRAVSVPFVPKLYSQIMSPEGINKLSDLLKEHSAIDMVMTYKDYYFGLIAINDTSFMYGQDISDFPDSFTRDQIRPLTLGDIFYNGAVKYTDDTYGTLTRYPVLDVGGIYPTKYTLRMTIQSSIKSLLDSDGQPTGIVANRFPDASSGYYNAVAVNFAHAPALSADFDGDAVGSNIVLTDEAKDEIKLAFKSVSNYRGVDGSLLYSAGNAYSESAFATLSQDPD